MSGSGLKRLCFLHLPSTWDKAVCTMFSISKTGTTLAQSQGLHQVTMIFPSWSSLLLSAPRSEPYPALQICAHPAPLSSPCCWLHPFIPNCRGTHWALVQAKSTSLFSHVSCHLVVSLTRWWPHGVHYRLPHPETAYVQLPCKPSRSPVLSVGSLRACSSEPLERRWAREERSFHGSLDSWLHIWNF